jgi:hypothetical protein
VLRRGDHLKAIFFHKCLKLNNELDPAEMKVKLDEGRPTYSTKTNNGKHEGEVVFRIKVQLNASESVEVTVSISIFLQGV